MLYSKTGIAEKNCIFTTKHDNMPKAVWVCSIYDPGNEVEYVKTIPEHIVTVVNIKTTQVNEFTECTVKYTILRFLPVVLIIFQAILAKSSLSSR